MTGAMRTLSEHQLADIVCSAIATGMVHGLHYGTGLSLDEATAPSQAFAARVTLEEALLLVNNTLDHRSADWKTIRL